MDFIEGLKELYPNTDITVTPINDDEVLVLFARTNSEDTAK